MAIIAIVVIVIVVIAGGAYAALVLSTHNTTTTSSSTSTTTTSGSNGYTVQIASSSSTGNYLENGSGFTLYMFGKDTPGNGASACTGSCAAAWPPFYADSGSLNLPSSLSSSNFSTITRSDGSKQTTYNGWPLYYFSSDIRSGSMLGEGANQYGGLWYAIPPTMQQSGGQVIGGQSYSVGIAYKSSFGFYLTNSSGFTLYYDSADTPNSGNTTCTATCQANWPIFYNSTLNFPPGLSSSQFKTITPFGTMKIVTYNGYPLFYWANDAKPGDATGQGIGGFYVANLSLSAPVTTTTTATSSSSTHTTSSYYGY